MLGTPPGSPLLGSIGWFYSSVARQSEAMSPVPNPENRFFILGSSQNVARDGCFYCWYLVRAVYLDYLCFVENSRVYVVKKREQFSPTSVCVLFHR